MYIHDWDNKDIVGQFFEEVVPKLIEEFKNTSFNSEIEFLEGKSRISYETSSDNNYVAERGVEINYSKINQSLKRYDLTLLPSLENITIHEVA
ncbi:MAG: hypothetical protein IJI41_08790 [Anaerolineaceae bacterium]|nr:hypothetical protein [Anaerolineaceae bacterium]